MGDDKQRKLDAIQSDVASQTSDKPDPFTLEEMKEFSSKPALRAEIAHQELVKYFNRRIDVLQTKLDKREQDCRELLPEVAELRQAKRSTRLFDCLIAAEITVGGALISGAGFSTTEVGKYVMLWVGWALIILGIVTLFLNTAFGWPKSKSEPRSGD